MYVSIEFTGIKNDIENEIPFNTQYASNSKLTLS